MRHCRLLVLTAMVLLLVVGSLDCSYSGSTRYPQFIHIPKTAGDTIANTEKPAFHRGMHTGTTIEDLGREHGYCWGRFYAASNKHSGRSFTVSEVLTKHSHFCDRSPTAQAVQSLAQTS